jgi:fermentation-respiration switch protein FrsA (DUF1100 family)
MTQRTASSLDGFWVGGFDAAEGWMVMYVVVQSADGTTSSTVDLPLLGVKELIPDKLTIGENQVGFVIDIAGQETIFDAEITEGAIVGQAKNKTTSSQFQLVRASGSPSEFPPEHMGIYELASGHDIFIGNITGAFDAAYHDFKTGRISVIFPNSSNTYFAGQELLIPFPTDVQIRFILSEDGRATALQWLEKGQPPIMASKVDFVYENAEFNNGKVQLAGTIVFPTGVGPHPGIVVVHGSGPQTRHMVRLYAESLARRGIATLMYDKRGTGQSSGHWESDYEDLAEDALAGVKLLQAHPDVYSHQIGLCGASQAGWIIPIAVARSVDVAFAVLLVSPAVSIARQNTLNVEYSMRASGYSEDDIYEAVAHVDLFNQVICTGGKWEEFQHSLERGRRSSWAKYAWSLERPRTAEEAAGSRAQMERNPLPTLQQVTCPILAIFGGSDTVVPYKENMARMKEALQQSRYADFTFHVLPRSMHIFTRSESGADADIPHTTHWLPEHLDIIADWILARTRDTQ